MRWTAAVVRAFVLLTIPFAPLTAQEAARLGIGVFTERYRFGDGHSIQSVSQLTIPVSVEVALGARASLLLSTGHAYVEMEGRDPLNVPNQTLRGPLDTQFRLGLSLSDRVVTFLAGTLPTGRRVVVSDELSLLAALSNDAIGFSAPSLGSGGNVAVGFSTAFPVGRMAVGVAATGLYAFPYEPVSANPVRLEPGAEARLRLGLEGPLASRTYLRMAGSFIARSDDRLADAPALGLGHRVVAYAALEQGLGPALVSMFAFDVFRGAPQLESTALGAAALPRGNLLAGGVTLTLPLTPGTQLAATGEYRVASAAPDLASDELVRQASVLRLGGELRQGLGTNVVVALGGSSAGGDARQGTAFHDLSGYRFTLRATVTP